MTKNYVLLIFFYINEEEEKKDNFILNINSFLCLNKNPKKTFKKRKKIGDPFLFHMSPW